MSTEFYNRNFRMPNSWNGSEDNNSKFSNYSMSFDGTQYISIPATTTGTLNTRSVSFWFKTSTISSFKGLMKFDTTNGKGCIKVFTHSSKIQVNGVGSNGVTNAYQVMTSTLSNDTWYHICIVSSPNTPEGKIYVNSIEDTNTGGAGTSADVDSFSYIGKLKVNSRAFNGQIDHCCVFDYALTDGTGGTVNQIAELYGSSSTGVGNPMAITNGRKPIFYAPLGDYSAYNGTEYLVPNSAVSDYVFEFSSDSIEVSATPSELSLPSTTVSSGGFSISFWYYHNTIVNFDVVLQSTNANANNGFGVWQSTTNNGLNFWVGHYLQGDLYTTNNYFTSQKWYNITCTFEGGSTHTSKIFIDGVLNNSVSYTTSRNIHSGENILIGGWPLYSRFFDGQISNAQVFNTTLPATGSNSVETIYNYGTPLSDMSGFTSLQGWWKLDASATFDGSNWSIEDSSSNSNTGTSSGMTAANLVQSSPPLLVNEPYSRYALNFDAASSDYIDCGNDSSLQFTGSFTISAWVKINDSGTNTVISKDSNASSGLGYHIDIRSGNSVKAWAYNASNAVQITGLSTGIWYHIAFVFESTGGSNGNQSLYINAGTPLTNSITNFAASTVKNLRIGGSEIISGIDMNGFISNVSIWNASLTSAQVTEIYNNGLPSNLNNHSSYSNLISWWTLGENSSFNTNWTVIDEKGTNNGTSANMAEDDLISGVGTSGNGISSGMSGGDNIVGEAPFSDSNALSINMPVTAKSTSVPS